MIKRIGAVVALLAALLLVPQAASAKPAPGSPKGKPPVAGQSHVAGCATGLCYDYAAAATFQSVTTQVSAMMQIPSPAPAISPQATDHHSLGELALQSGVSPSYTDAIVEVGYTVDKNMYGDTKARLFTYYWVNGVGGGYGPTNLTLFAGRTYNPGQDLTPLAGTAIKMEIVYQGGNWWIGVNNTWVGYYATTLWTGATPPVAFTSGNKAQAFGEVAIGNSDTTCTDMGNRKFASDTTAAYMTDLQINRGTNNPAGWQMNATYPSKWTVSAFDTTLRKFRYGGPSTC